MVMNDVKFRKKDENTAAAAAGTAESSATAASSVINTATPGSPTATRKQ